MSPEHALDSLFEPLSRCLDAESASRVVELKIAKPLQERIDLLAMRANEGILSESERSEYDALINAADFTSILKLKARRYLEPDAAKRALIRPRALLVPGSANRWPHGYRTIYRPGIKDK